MTTYATTIAHIRDAAERIAPYAHRTPVLTCSALDKLAGCHLFFKCENFQKVGAFKFRGANNAILRLNDDVTERGVVTHSSGNHAQAVALAASIRGIAAHVVMPNNAPTVKRIATEGYGATVYLCEPTLADRERGAESIIERTGATMIPPFNHPDVIAGQGTVMTELFEQVDGLEAVIAPVGGGGLLSGVSIAARGLNPDIRVFGAEPEGADDAARSLKSGQLMHNTETNTIADGLLTNLGSLTWPIIRDHVERIVTVSDDAIIQAMQLVWERMKIIIEPSAAVAVAAVLGSDFAKKDNPKRVGVVISGGNVDLTQLPF